MPEGADYYMVAPNSILKFYFLKTFNKFTTILCKVTSLLKHFRYFNNNVMKSS